LNSKLSRRKFLTTGIGIAAVAGMGYLTKDHWSQFIQNIYATTPSLTPTPAQTIEPLSTTPSDKVDLELLLFHDYHGDGVKQDDEPVITDASFDVIDENGEKVLEGIEGNGNGIYKLDDLVEGKKYSIQLTDAKYEYISLSNIEFVSVNDYDFIANQYAAKESLGLMEGFLTLPFKKGTGEYRSRLYVNISHDSKPKDWKEGVQTYQRGDYKHTGTDLFIRQGTPVLATAPGNIYYFKHARNNGTGGHLLILEHMDGYYTVYNHLSEIRRGIFRRGLFTGRGEIIGWSGIGTNGGQHLHFGVQKPYNNGIDPYRSLVPGLGSEVSLWTKDNNPQYPVTED